MKFFVYNNMKNIKLVLTVILAAFLFNNCKKRVQDPIDIFPFEDEHKYFPVKDGRTWNYETTLYGDKNVLISTHEDIGVYSMDSGCINNFRDGKFISSSYWANSSSKMTCCNGRTLIDYSIIGEKCIGDSVLTHTEENSGISIKMYQNCGRQYATMVMEYKDVECIRTYQKNTFSSGKTLEIINYFGYEVGLIYREEINKDAGGLLIGREVQKLKSHNF